MFGEKITGKIRSIIPTRKDSNGELINRCSLALQYEFTPQLAAGIGDDAKVMQGLLGNGAMKSATLHMDAAVIVADFGQGGDKLHLKEAKGVDLVGRAANKEDAHPTAKLTISFPTVDEHLLWFVHHLDESVSIKLDRQQTEIPGA